MLAKFRQGSLNVFHLEAEMFDANLTGSTLSLRATLQNGEVDVAIGQKNTVEPQADLFETEDLLVKGGCLLWICRPDSNVLNSGHEHLLCASFNRWILPSLESKLAEIEDQRSFFLSMPLCQADDHRVVPSFVARSMGCLTLGISRAVL